MACDCAQKRLVSMTVNRLTLSLSMAMIYFPVKYPFSGARQIETILYKNVY
jgi:hypothetical protein